MRFASLGSGSQGNSLIVETGATRLLIDCGFSARAMLARLGRLAVDAESISAILVTHEHGDHVGGVSRFARRFGIPVYLTQGTLAAVATSGMSPDVYELIDAYSPLTIGGFLVQPFTVPHDAREPVQYVFSDGRHRLGVLTDTGSVTQHAVDVLHDCDGLVVECNHDPALLEASAYPYSLKRRVAGQFGHLANAQAAELLSRIDTRHLQHVVAAHLSEKNNRSELAANALASVLNCTEEWIGIATQDEGIGWRQLL